MSSVFHRLPSTLNGAGRISFRLQPQSRPQLSRQLTLSSCTSRSLRRPWNAHYAYQVRHESNESTSPKRKAVEPPFIGLRNYKWKGTANFVEEVRQTFWVHPFVVTTLLSAIFVALAFSGKLAYDYFRTIPEVSRYPPEVRADLRRAIYFGDYQQNTELALKYYESAFKKLKDMGVDHFTPEIIYLKVKFASWAENEKAIPMSIQILEHVMSDNNRWIKERFKPGKEGQRKDVLLANVRIANKLAELYTDDRVLQIDKAEERLVYAVETIMKEHKRREEEGVKEGEGDWINDEEFVAMLEQTAHHFEAKDDHYLAAPLFLQAITKLDPKNCHMAVLMNNLSICLAQQVVPQAPGQKAVPRSIHVSNARAWSLKALEIASKIQPPDRNDECDIGCAVATHNLGEFAEMDGNIAEARKRYEEAKSLAKAIGFKEGVANAESGIQRVSKKK